MRMSPAVLTMFLVAIACSIPAVGEPAYDSFEGGAVPSHWVPSREGTLQLSDRHFKHGEQSLRWDFRPADTIRVEADLGDTSRYGGYGGTYAKATFGIWIYCRQPLAGALRFEFRTDAETDAWFEFPLGFTGWRRAHLKYTVAPHSHLATTRWAVEFEGQVRPTTNHILIHAPDGEGSVFFDLVVYNGLLDYRRQHLPDGYSWQPFPPDPATFPLPATVSEAERQGSEFLAARLDRIVARSGDVDEERMAAFQERIAALGVVRDEAGIRGKPVVHSQWMEFYRGIEGIVPASEIANQMLPLARAYHWTENEAYRRQIAEWYCLLAEHLRDQGMDVASGFSWGWYDGRNLGEANYLMREPLRERGLLAWAVDYLDYSYGFSRIFDDTSIRPNMDYFHMDVRYRLYGCLMQVDPAEQVRHLHAYSRRLDLDIRKEDGPDGYKPDGSAFHHRFHYFAYAGYSTRSLVNLVEPLSQTAFRLSPAAMERLKQVALAMRFYCNLRDLPLPLAGRHPFSQALDPNILRILAQCGSPDGSEDLDPDLAAAYLRLVPEEAGNDLYRERGIEPETLAGNLTMNYAGLTAHRRDDWLALVKGYSRYVAFGEIYARNNRFGRYLSNGYLDILGGGEPVSRAGSGVVQDGWDWNRLDGTTVVYLPLDQLQAVRSGTEFIPSEQTFVGGLSHRNWNGAFVMQLHGHERHEPGFRGRKTYFFFDDRILCLGSDIANSNSVHPTHTNLFQKHLPNPAEGTTWINGEAVAGLDGERRLPEGEAGWIIDPQGTGYWLAPQQNVRTARRRQTSRDHSNRTDTEGDFATAWIDHGTAPADGEYEYAVLVRTSPERMREFARAMADADRRPYEVLQRDRTAHIVFDRETATWGAVLFEAQTLRPGLPLLAVDRACLAMVEPTGADGLHLSVADPDLNLEDHASQPRVLRLRIRGAWELAEPTEDVRLGERDTESTEIVVRCREGRSYDVRLLRAANF